MRGAVTLAAALAIPLTTDAGAPFAGRDLIVFLAFCVVFATLVLQGLTMPLVIRALGLEDDGLDVKEEAKARIHAAEAAIARLDELIDEAASAPTRPSGCAALYQFRQQPLPRALRRRRTTARSRSARVQYQRARRELLEAER